MFNSYLRIIYRSICTYTPFITAITSLIDSWKSNIYILSSKSHVMVTWNICQLYLTLTDNIIKCFEYATICDNSFPNKICLSTIIVCVGARWNVPLIKNITSQHKLLDCTGFFYICQELLQTSKMFYILRVCNIIS